MGSYSNSENILCLWHGRCWHDCCAVSSYGGEACNQRAAFNLTAFILHSRRSIGTVQVGVNKGCAGIAPAPPRDLCRPEPSTPAARSYEFTRAIPHQSRRSHGDD